MDSHPFCSREDVPKASFEYEMPEELYMQRLEKVTKQGGGVIKEISPYPLPSMQEAIEHTLDLTRQEIIPVFDTVTDLKTCAEYFQKYDSLCMRIDERAAFNWEVNYKEQLFNLKVYNTIDELVAAKDKNREVRIQMWKHRVRQGWSGYVEESEEEKRKEREEKQKRMELYEKLFHDPEIHAEALAELERRRQRNTETLREYGLL